MPRVTLTDRFVAGIKSNKTRQTDFFDSKCIGLTLRVSDTGYKTWTYVFTASNNKRARVVLGNYPALPLAAARTKAIEARGDVGNGIDPRAIKKHGTAHLTVAELFDRYITDPDKAKLKSLYDIKCRFKNALPIIGHIRLTELTKRDVKDVTDKILKRGARTQAWHVHKDIRSVLGWAVANDFLQHSPLDRVKPPGGFNVCERTLSDDEIHTLWHGLPNAFPRSIACQRILRLCLITGQRLGEVSGLMRSEIDLKKKLWSLPGARVKNGHQHSVPLSDLAVTTIREAMADSNGEAIFPADDGGPIISPRITRAVLRVREKSPERFGIAEWSPHDLRRTCLDNLARLGVAPHTISHVANHRSLTKSNITFAHYITHSFEAEKRSALDLWSNRLTAIIGDKKTASVVPMKRVRR
jgi:integrase